MKQGDLVEQEKHRGRQTSSQQGVEMGEFLRSRSGDTQLL